MKAQLKIPGDRPETDSLDGDRDSLDGDTQARAMNLFRSHGALWLENALSPHWVQRLSEAYHQRYASLSRLELRKRYAMVGDNRYMITLKMKRPFNSPTLYANPILLPILQGLLGSDCVISSLGSVLAFPGAAAQSIHFDYPPLFESEETCVRLPPHAITVVVPLIDLTEQTGSTALWEGSHAQVGARGRLRELSESGSFGGSVMPLAKLGDVYLMDFRLIHAGTANQSDQPRPILYLVYSRPWFREDMNFDEQPPIRISRKQYQRVPEEYRHLFASAHRPT